MEEKIRIENVTKKFGSYAALDGISLSFEKGKIHGMIGRNGSGKTVLFKCICGFLRVDDGAVFVDGKQIGKEIEAPESIGAIIETPGFLPGYSARQNLQFLAGIRRKIGKKEIDAAIRKVGLDPEAKKHVGKYSLGMRQRLGIAQAIMEEPSLLKDDTELKRVKQLEKDISTIESKKSRLTDLLIDGKIEQEDYDEKKLSFQRKLHKITEEKAYLEENIGQQKNISRRMSQLRQTLENENALDEFDRIVFESIVEKVIVGGYDAEGNPTPYKLTFVLKCNQTLKVDNAKADYRANQKGKKVS